MNLLYTLNNMTNQIIDLRKNASSADEEADLSSDDLGKEVEDDGETSDVQHKAGLLEWYAPEYEEKQYSDRWFMIAGGIGLAMVILGILSKSYFFVALVVLAFVVMVMYAKRPPRKIYFAVSGRGVQVGKKVYQASELKSFWFFKRPGYQELSVETKRTVSPFILLPLGDTDPEEVREILLGFLPEEEHQESYSDIFARRLGF